MGFTGENLNSGRPKFINTGEGDKFSSQIFNVVHYKGYIYICVCVCVCQRGGVCERDFQLTGSKVAMFGGASVVGGGVPYYLV